MLGLVNLEVYISIFKITEENNKLQINKFPDEKVGGVSYEKVRDEIERELDISDITATDLQGDLIGPIIIEEYKEQVTKRMKDEQYMLNLSYYNSSVFQDFESFLRTQCDLVEDDIKLVSDENISSFITYKITPGIYAFKDLSEALFNILQLEYPESSSEIVIEFDDITRKTKLAVKSGIIAKRFDEKSFYRTISGFTPGWDYKHYNQYISQKIVNLKTINKIHLKFDAIHGTILDGFRQPILFSCVLDKPGGYKVFCEPETTHYKKYINLF